MPAADRPNSARKKPRTALQEAVDTLNAIRGGGVDGLLVRTAGGDEVFTLRGAEHPYRVMVEEMREGAVTLVNGGTIAYCNPRFAEMLQAPADVIVGSNIDTFVSRGNLAEFRRFMMKASRLGGKAEISLTGMQGNVTPCVLTLSPMKVAGGSVCLLAMDVSSMKEAEERVKASLREKEFLLREVYHRVKNNLQVISSLFRLQSVDMDEAARRVFEASQARVHAMALVHQKLCQSDDLSRIELGDYLGQLARDLFQSFSTSAERISYVVEACPASFSIDTAMPLGLIANELVSNALKHAFPGRRKGTVRMELKRKEEGYVFRVSDDGVGLGGVTPGEKASFGLWIVRTLASQVRGATEMDASSGGFSFSVAFPDPAAEEKRG